MADETGVESNIVAVTASLNRWAADNDKAFVGNVHQVAIDALDLIRDSYVPILSGRLSDSGRVDSPHEVAEGVTNIDLVFDAPYAAAVNFRPENEGRHDPSRPLAGSHYLERGVLSAIIDMHKRTANGLGGNPWAGADSGTVESL